MRRCEIYSSYINELCQHSTYHHILYAISMLHSILEDCRGFVLVSINEETISILFDFEVANQQKTSHWCVPIQRLANQLHLWFFPVKSWSVAFFRWIQLASGVGSIQCRLPFLEYYSLHGWSTFWHRNVIRLSSSDLYQQELWCYSRLRWNAKWNLESSGKATKIGVNWSAYPFKQCAAVMAYSADTMAQPQKCFEIVFFCTEHWYGACPSAASCPPMIRGKIDCGSTAAKVKKMKIQCDKIWIGFARIKWKDWLTFESWNFASCNWLQDTKQNSHF